MSMFTTIRFRPRLILWVVTCIVLAGLITYEGTADNHHTNIRYLLWKYRLRGGDAKLGLRYFNVDMDFRLSLYGKTKSEVERWFPVLVPYSPSDLNDKYYGPLVHHVGFFWIDHSLWGILFEHDRVTEIRSFEG